MKEQGFTLLLFLPTINVSRFISSQLLWSRPDSGNIFLSCHQIVILPCYTKRINSLGLAESKTFCFPQDVGFRLDLK